MSPSAAPRKMRELLSGIAEKYGTPLFAYDLDTVSSQIFRLREYLPNAVQILYSLKANPSLGLCNAIASHGLGADISSIGEALVALEAGFAPAKICVSGPYKSPELRATIAKCPEIKLSIDSVSELEILVRDGVRHGMLLRLRPDFQPVAAITMGSMDRFGIPLDQLSQCRAFLSHSSMLGFHVYWSTQILGADIIAENFRRSYDLCLRAADILKLNPAIINLGGGFGVPYRTTEQPLDLDSVAVSLSKICAQLPETCIMLELGRYIVAEAGWYLTTVVGHQMRDHATAVVVDGGTHQRADLCGIGLKTGSIPPLVLSMTRPPEELQPTDVLGCLCLPSDILAERVPLPSLSIGDVLAFPNAGAYGLTASPAAFLSHPYPAEIAFRHERTALLRDRSYAAADLLCQRKAGPIRLPSADRLDRHTR